MLCPRVVLMAGLVLPVLTSCLAEDSGRPVGDRCTGDGNCRTGLHCVYGRCRQPCTTDRDCGIGTACVPSKDDPSIYVCTLADEGGGDGCPDGLTEDGTGMCRRPCEPAGPEPYAPCGPAQSCDQGWCRAVLGGDAGVPGGGDSGLDDGAVLDGGETSTASRADGSAPLDGSASADGRGDDGDPASLDWVSIAGGSFQMGSSSGEDDELPVHEVTVPTFEMLRTEVTVAQYGECVDGGPCTTPNTGGTCNWSNRTLYANHPVNCVVWHQMDEFCRWAGGRLPSEAEWEYAARSGGQDITYPWGNEAPTCTYAVMSEGVRGCGTNRTWPVCSKPASNTTQGLCDMAGNVWEWTQDWHHSDYIGAPTDGSAWDDNGRNRVVRGGGFDVEAHYLRTANRSYSFDPAERYFNVSARCAR